MKAAGGYFILLILVALGLLCGCTSSRHVEQGKYLLDKVKLVIDDSVDMEESQMMAYVRHQPNHKMLWSIKFRLGVYNLSGRDTTKWYNRWVRKLGEAPVTFDTASMERDSRQLLKAMENMGYLHASVVADTVVNEKKRKVELTYRLHPGEPHTIHSVAYEFLDTTLRDIIMADSAHFTVRPGDNLNLDKLEEQREIVTNYMRNRGYYAFGKESISFNADTTAGSRDVDLTMIIREDVAEDSPNFIIPTHKPYFVRKVYYITDYDPAMMAAPSGVSAVDTVAYRDITIFYGKKHYLRPSVLYDNCFIRAGQPYTDREVNNTYTALTRLGILKFINIKFENAGSTPEFGLVDAYICLTPGKTQSFSAELEGTNSEGDLGVAVALGYSHRNVGKGSETLNLRLRGAYEAISRNIDGLIHNRYLETSADVGVEFPKFKAPFLSEKFKRKIKATSELNLSINYQERPEYTRIISTAGWGYKWSERGNRTRHTFTIPDINYVYLPESTYDFLDQIAPDNPLLRYSYEDHFIMRMGYSFYHTNKRRDLPWQRSSQRDIYTVRVNAELAGNVLFAISSIFDYRRNFHDDPYKVFGIRYSQYFKAEGHFSHLHLFDHRNSLAWHVGAGVGVPYGNSSILPFEKRFYGGGANGVRGWDVRTLGPGRFPGSNNVSDFINQCGDIRLEMSVEYRAKLFWLLELGAFIDIGNIWTIRNYSNQPGGMFQFNSFYKELAGAYGLGLRLDFNYFLLRFDLGMKAHNPAMGAEPWPLIHPDWHRDSSFHFSIGYPF